MFSYFSIASANFSSKAKVSKYLTNNKIYIIEYCLFSNNGRNTWIIDPSQLVESRQNFDIKPGPSMIHKRPIKPKCAKMKINGRTFIVAAGGVYNHDWDTDSHK